MPQHICMVPYDATDAQTNPAIQLDTCPLRYGSAMAVELIDFTLGYVLSSTRSTALPPALSELRQSGALRSRYAGLLFRWFDHHCYFPS